MAEATHVDSVVRQGVLVATIKSPAVSLYEADVIGRQIESEAPGARWRIAIDFSHVELLASAGLGMLVKLQKTASDHKGKLVLAGLSKETVDVLKMTRLNRILVIETDIEDAVRKLC